MTVSRTQALLIGGAFLILLVSVFAGGRSCSGGCRPSDPDPIVVGVDAGPGEDEISARLDAALVAGRARIEEIEEKFEDDMDAFDARQREEYERLRGGDDLDAAARYLSEWNRRRRVDAGR